MQGIKVTQEDFASRIHLSTCSVRTTGKAICKLLDLSFNSLAAKGTEPMLPPVYIEASSTDEFQAPPAIAGPATPSQKPATTVHVAMFCAKLDLPADVRDVAAGIFQSPAFQALDQWSSQELAAASILAACQQTGTPLTLATLRKKCSVDLKEKAVVILRGFGTGKKGGTRPLQPVSRRGEPNITPVDAPLLAFNPESAPVVGPLPREAPRPALRAPIPRRDGVEVRKLDDRGRLRYAGRRYRLPSLAGTAVRVQQRGNKIQVFLLDGTLLGILDELVKRSSAGYVAPARPLAPENPSQGQSTTRKVDAWGRLNYAGKVFKIPQLASKIVRVERAGNHAQITALDGALLGIIDINTGTISPTASPPDQPGARAEQETNGEPVPPKVIPPTEPKAVVAPQPPVPLSAGLKSRVLQRLQGVTSSLPLEDLARSLHSSRDAVKKLVGELVREGRLGAKAVHPCADHPLETGASTPAGSRTENVDLGTRKINARGRLKFAGKTFKAPPLANTTVRVERQGDIVHILSLDGLALGRIDLHSKVLTLGSNPL